MVQFILDNGNLDLDMVVENNYGRTDQSMKVIGEAIWHMEKAD
jgi:hypothetical protein